jgi:beta-1,4-mannosyltransferase
MRVLLAPDYRVGVPYQTLLANALGRRGIEVSFLSNNYRWLPLFRGSRTGAPDIIHIHWPEEYFPKMPRGWNLLPVSPYLVDCWLTRCNRPIVVTAHNLLPHNRANERGVYRNVRYTMQSARAVFVHSTVARQQLRERFAVSDDYIHTIPHGDLSVGMGRPLPRDAARTELQLPLDTKICLVFGSVSPYKGSDELVRFWAENKLRHRLVVIGPIFSEPFANKLYELAQGYAMVDLRLLSSWLDEAILRVWLSAADCCIFNYREIFTSGAAALARSYGLPLLIPSRLTSVDLDEPHPRVVRFVSFETDFCAKLERALGMPCDYESASEWRRKTSWECVAEMTTSVYRKVLAKRFK